MAAVFGWLLPGPCLFSGSVTVVSGAVKLVVLTSTRFIYMCSLETKKVCLQFSNPQAKSGVSNSPQLSALSWPALPTRIFLQLTWDITRKVASHVSLKPGKR